MIGIIILTFNIVVLYLIIKEIFKQRNKLDK